MVEESSGVNNAAAKVEKNDNVEEQQQLVDNNKVFEVGIISSENNSINNDETRPSNTEETAAMIRRNKRSSTSSGARRSTIKDLLLSDRVIARTMLVVKFLVLAETMNSTILLPNYPLMVNSAIAGSFPSVKPFEDNSSAALFLLQGSDKIGMAFGSLFMGHVSDKIGRKPVMLFTSFICIIGSIGKYFLRHTYWGFIAMTIVTGLGGSVLSVAVAYSSDLLKTRLEIEQAIGSLFGIMMLSYTGGGLISAFMGTTHGLFNALWVGVAVNVIAVTVGFFCVIEPPKSNKIIEDQSKNNMTVHKLSSASPPMNDTNVKEGENDTVSNTTTTNKDGTTEDDVKETITSSKVINWKLVGLILLASLFDQFGSSIQQILVQTYSHTIFTLNFLDAGETPIMSTTAFQYYFVCCAFMIIPASMASAHLFARFGPASSAIGANIITVVQIIALYEVASIEPPSKVTYAIFYTILYVMLPVTYISQLSTGPMMARIAPANKRGLVQGLNTFSANISGALAPFLMGVAYDQVGVSVTTWIGVGLCVGSALVNVPLAFVKVLGRSHKKKKEGQDLPPDYHDGILKYEDGDIIASTSKISTHLSMGPGMT